MLGFGKELRRAAAESAVVPRLIADRPEEWRLGPLTAVVAPAGVQLRYARNPVGRATCDPDSVMAAWRRTLEGLNARSLAPDELLPLLEAAYDGLIAERGGQRGERVELVELRGALARRRRGHSRAQFAWDLARLRRERRLRHGARRIDLGVATGDVALRTSRVVWIEDESGAGHYYFHFRMIEEASG